jgi:hypothetical protein
MIYCNLCAKFHRGDKEINQEDGWLFAEDDVRFFANGLSLWRARLLMKDH